MMLNICFKCLTVNTIRFNFAYFPFSLAIKFPVFIASTIYIKNLKGNVKIEGKIKTGMIKIGYGDVAIFDKINSRGIWQNHGTIIFTGIVFIGHGSKINCGPNAKLSFGGNFTISAESTIVANFDISFGDNCLISWDILIMDSDFHQICNKDSEVINKPIQIIFGDSVWIGCRSMILKGSIIPNNTVISAGSIVNKKLKEENSIYGGNPLRVLSKDIQ